MFLTRAAQIIGKEGFKTFGYALQQKMHQNMTDAKVYGIYQKKIAPKQRITDNKADCTAICRHSGSYESMLAAVSGMDAEYIAVCDENAMMRMQVHEFEDILYLAKNLVFDGFCYWLVTGSIKQGPFCQNCYNREGALIRLDTNNGKGTCSICGHVMERDPRLTRPTHPRTSKSGARILPFRR